MFAYVWLVQQYAWIDVLISLSVLLFEGCLLFSQSFCIFNCFCFARWLLVLRRCLVVLGNGALSLVILKFGFLHVSASFCIHNFVLLHARFEK